MIKNRDNEKKHCEQRTGPDLVRRMSYHGDLSGLKETREPGSPLNIAS